MPTIVSFGGSTPQVDPTAWVASNATLVGAVTLGAHSSVFYGAVIRADTDSITIGAGSNVQDNCVLHTDSGIPLVVGARVSIGHGAVVHGCTIEANCLIGMNATVLNGAVVGAGTLIAAGAVVLEDTLIPAGSLVTGVPARAVRTLTPEERAFLIENARHYAELSDSHKKVGG